jgi:two-component system KDP operon response regulator KdpE
VDDDPQFRRVIRVALRAHGYDVAEAGDGYQALSEIQAKAIDVVLLDWKMPGMDGEATCQAIRSTSKVPIIVVTASDRVSDTFATRVNAVFHKPVDIETLLACIDAGSGRGIS